MSKEGNARIFERLQGMFAQNDSVVFVNVAGVGVSTMERLRVALRNEGAGLVNVKAKPTKVFMGSHAVNSNVGGISEVTSMIKGSLFAAYSNDVVSLAKVVHAFAKDNTGKCSVLCGINCGDAVSSSDVALFATMPSMVEMQAILVSVLSSRARSLCDALGGNSQRLVTLLDNYRASLS